MKKIAKAGNRYAEKQISYGNKLKRNLIQSVKSNDSSSFLLRRKSERYSLNKKITIRFTFNSGPEQKTKAYSGEIQNVTDSGILLSTNIPISISTKIEILLPKTNVSFRGTLMWSLEEPGNRFYYGVSISLLATKSIFELLSIAPNSLLDNIIGDRRTNTRRIDPNPEFAASKRNYERRIKNRLFEKCIRFTHWDNYIKQNSYFYLREMSSAATPQTIVKGSKMIMLGSNNYLGLSTHPKVKEAAIKAIEKYGTGACGSRIINGNFDIHNQLEATIAKHKGTEDCIVYSTGYMTNLGGISTILDKQSIAILDDKCHASIIDGCTLGQIPLAPYKHNNMKELEKKLIKYADHPNKLIITEGVFSMDGDVAKLDEIYSLANKYGTAIMIDDAHGTGVLGKNGRGTVEHYGLEGKIDIIMGTFSKTLAGVGGFIAGSKKIIHFLKHSSRSFVFSAGIPAAVCAASIAAFEIIETEPQLRINLWKNINYLKNNLLELGYTLGETQSAIIPILTFDENKTYKLVGALEKAGVYCNPIIYPAVRKREARIRVSAMATHTISELSKALDAFKKAGKETGVI
ncbi:MAG: pyridoxal phosphate-dependent aminotransferase family protein [bacterium]|nr:pyridoxal phosphate-dependent aminotransferase family protein [bacterium]